ncbi:hypothetical protein [Paraburkholderia dinghuensis]|nr:hypothetical protein [Paraburkholderia dinghuensis]
MTQAKALPVEEARAHDIPIDFETLMPAHEWDKLEQLLSQLR